MSNIPRRRRVKRPVLLVKHSQLNKKNHLNIRSYKPLYEKLKANNNALAKALASERQETQYLFVQNNALTCEVQELRVARNRQDDIISGLLKNAKETLQCILSMTPYVTNTIATCQQGLTASRLNPRKSTSNNRRDSVRRLSGKSPARGVVQPMVSGHTITKPTINLSRLNLQRVRAAPNLSDIDESLTPEQSPTLTVSPGPVTSRIPRSLHYGTRGPIRLPERLEDSIRTSDTNERRSSARRNSIRDTSRRTRGPAESPVTRPSNQPPLETHTGECLKSPRIALHDVSRLLQNAQSVNIRTLLETTSDLELSQSHQQSDPESCTVKITVQTPTRTLTEGTIDSESERNDSSPSPELQKSKPKPNSTSNGDNRGCGSGTKWSASSPSDVDDPLEGPSWLLNETDSNNISRENEVSTTINNLTLKLNAKDRVNCNHSDSSSEDDDDNDKNKKIRKNLRIPESESSPKPRNRRSTIGTNDQRNGSHKRWSNQSTGLYRNLDDDNQSGTMNVARFVTRRRGSGEDDYNDDEYYTLLYKTHGKRKEYRFDLEDLELPILESPIAAPVQPRIMEPEQTTNIQRITQTFGNYGPTCPYPEDTIFEHTGLVLPVIPDNLDTARSVVEQDEQSSEEEIIFGRAKRNGKKKVMFSSPSESDRAPTPPKKNSKIKRKVTNAKDPSAAKVVLQKLSPDRKRKPSYETRESQGSERQGGNSLTPMRREDSSDSEGSNASSKTAQTRPRRKKAPKNLQEPNLSKKLRRN